MATYTQAHAYWNGFSPDNYPPVPAVQEQRSMSVTNLLLHQAHSQIRELEKKLADMSKLAHEDQLTGILNRRGFDASIARAKRQGAGTLRTGYLGRSTQDGLFRAHGR